MNNETMTEEEIEQERDKFELNLEKSAKLSKFSNEDLIFEIKRRGLEINE